MRIGLLAGLALLMLPAAASAMPVSTFLAKAEALKKKGPLAIFSGDLKLLTKQIEADGAALRAQNKAAAAAGRRKAYCTPGAGVKIGQKEVLDAMNAVPPAKRMSTTTQEAMRDYFARRFPCPLS